MPRGKAGERERRKKGITECGPYEATNERKEKEKKRKTRQKGRKKERKKERKEAWEE